jgi:ABC-2 type transport system permease protein
MRRFGFLARTHAILVKEFVQMRRDKLTFGMMVGIPILQLILFGYAINMDPKHLPTLVVMVDDSRPARSILAALENSDYFRVVGRSASETEANESLDRGQVAFVVNIPANFERDLVRGSRPEILVEADATDPAASSNALGALSELLPAALAHDLVGPLASLVQGQPPITLIVHRRYNPEAITQLNIVPGLLGIVLTMSMTMMTALALTREVERGTMENLLAMPVHPIEVMVGKVLPNVGIGMVQVTIILITARFLFNVPNLGSTVTLACGIFLFIATMLMLGYTFSTFARTQMQAMQMTFFFFLPQLLLSGYMFPYRGMPVWAQVLGNAFPLTHFLRIVRGVLLKGNGFGETFMSFAALGGIFALFVVAALARYRRTLD